MEIVNAKIESAELTMEDHGILTFYLTLSGEGWGCVYGGYCLGHGYLGAKHFDASGKGLESVMRIMDVVGVSKFTDLKGKYVRAVTEGWGGTISKIGNLIEDKWFDYKEFFKKEET